MPDPAPAGFFEGVFDRTLTNLRSAWRDIADSARGVLSGTPRPDLPGEDASRLHQQMLSSLDGRAGGVTARARAADLGRTYLSLDPAGRERFLQLLAREFDVDHDEVRRRCQTLIEAAEPAQRIAEERALRDALEPPRITVLRQFNALPEGVKFLVDRRAELIDLGRRDPLLNETAPIGDPQTADAAIFYSISNCQRGLAGISFGDFLIKRVADALAIELPRLKTFATLSPVPGFRAWLDRQDRSAPGELLLPAEQAALEALGEEAPGGDLLSALDQEGWHNDQRIAGALREPLLRLCARYLVGERAPSGRALDPVAHFHLSNGARVERLNWLADVSVKGLQQSAGIMVNYLYRLGEIEANHEAYRGEGRVAASSALRNLARGG